MKNKIFKAIALPIVFITLLSLSTVVLAYNSPQVSTYAATNTQNNQATLNGYLSDLGGYGSATVWFEYGTTTSYGNTTNQTSQNYVGQFSQTVSSLTYNTTYHYRAAVQTAYGTSYGADQIFYTGSGTGSFYVQTNSATNVQNNSATLNGYLYFASSNNNYTSYVWFEYGTTTSYGNTTSQQSLNHGSFSKNVVSLTYNTTYHYRAIARSSSGNTVYGQDMTFNTGNTGGGTSGLTINKKVINLTSGNLNWQPSVNAKPSDLLSFAITLSADSGQDINNVVVRDVLPANLIYKGNLAFDTNVNYSGGNLTSGISFGTIPAGQIRIISYQAQVASDANIAYGMTTLSNSATVTGSNIGSQTATASVIINKSAVSGATTITTGLTDNLLVDSIIIPLLIIIAGLWLYFSGNAGRMIAWVKSR